jgi:beta-lactamase class D
MLPRICKLLFVLLPLSAFAAAPIWQEHPEWKSEFTGRDVSGTALIYDEQANHYLVFDRQRSETRFTPASTFKVFNAMVALDTGAVKDEYEVIRWDGVKREFDMWNRDHSLASGMKYSAVWFYQEMARRAGQQRMQEWLDKVGYGNRDTGGGIDQFWLTKGALRISALEEVEFLRRLADGTLPFSARAQETVRRITLTQDEAGYMIHSKTGWGTRNDVSPPMDLGWYVGWVERAGRRWFFAINIDMPKGGDDTVKRAEVAQALLRRIGALPASAPK